MGGVFLPSPPGPRPSLATLGPVAAYRPDSFEVAQEEDFWAGGGGLLGFKRVVFLLSQPRGQVQQPAQIRFSTGQGSLGVEGPRPFPHGSQWPLGRLCLLQTRVSRFGPVRGGESTPRRAQGGPGTVARPGVVWCQA